MKVVTKNPWSFCVVMFTMLLCSSCSHYKSISDNKKIDTRLVGTWIGEEEDKQMKGVKKQWEMLRNDDGTFQLLFKVITNGKVNEHIEVGTWWVKDGLFYEYHDISKLTDTYKFDVVNKDLIKFEMQKSKINFNDVEYIFFDARKGTSKVKLD
jgi:hypothetical protein